MNLSDPTTLVLSAILCFFVALFFYGRKRSGKYNLPPGPRPLPIIGNLHILDLKKPYQTLHQLSKKYGPVYTIKLGEEEVVVLCGYEAVKDALVNHADEFSGRPIVPLFQEVTKGYGVIFAHGDNWKVMRRFTLSTLRDFGMGKEGIENKIIEESDFLVQKFKSYKGEPFDNLMIINAAVANIIVSILLSHRFAYEDPTLVKLLKIVHENTELAGTPAAVLYNAFPSVMRWCSRVKHTVRRNVDEMHVFVRKTFTNQRKELDANDQRNLIDSFLVKQQEEKPELYFSNENLTALVTDLFGAGMETTSTTLRWGLLLMMKYPKVQRKVQSEIEKVIGLAEPQVIHRKQMPYTDAVIHEIQRFGNIVPTNLPHATTQDVNFRGYLLPKGTHVMPLLTSVLYDKNHFVKADEFYPEHFLDSSGNCVRKEAFMPFSAGSAEDMLPLDPVTVLLSIVICILLAAIFYNKKENVHPNYPPGPKPLPIIGNILNLNVQKPHLSFQELAKKYGPVFSIKIGVEKMVVLCGYDTVKEAFVKEEFLDRPMTPAFMDLTGGYGIAFLNGNNWKTMRQFTVSTLRDFGMGKRSLEEKINEESNCLVQMFKCYKGEPFDNTMAIHAAVANNIVSILLGRRFDYDDPKLQRTIRTVNNCIRILGSPMVMLYNAFPSVMRWIPGSHHSIRKNISELHSFIQEIFMKQRDQLDINDQRNLIDCFRVKQKQEKPNPERHFHDENLISLVRDLFVAGMETTASTLRWSLLLMMKYPEIQKNVQKEIEEVIGLAEPQMAHRKRMPYTDAVIHEIQRFINIFPNGVPRSTTQDLILKDFFIPKGTYIIPSLTSVLREAKYFKKPDEFYPQHFLDADGNFVKNEAFMPFSAGKRNCVGANLAKMELFLYFTKLLQSFTFKVPPGVKLDLNAAVGFVAAPHKHEICALFRNNEQHANF